MSFTPKIKLKENARSNFARSLVLTFPGFNGVKKIKTPAFMPVATKGAVKATPIWDLENMGTQIMICNTYHLYLRPGHENIEAIGGLHKFMGWNGVIATDSGGFQIFSLKENISINDDFVSFKSHIDGSMHEFTPELSMSIQKSLGSDIVMSFDECPPYTISNEKLKTSINRTLKWAERGLKVRLKDHQSRFAIIQGGIDKELRTQSAYDLCSMPFDGFGVGGLSVGEPVEKMYEIVEHTTQLMPENRPRYLMGVGRPQDIIESVKRGIDLFDCVIPTRNARNGQVFTKNGKINIKNSCYKKDPSPLDINCKCLTCKRFSKAYLRHLSTTKEYLWSILGTHHNLYFYTNLMNEIRLSIEENYFNEWTEKFYTSYFNK